MANTDSSFNSTLLPTTVNALMSVILTYPPWTKLLLWKLEYPSFIIAVMSAIIGTVIALQLKIGNIKIKTFLGASFCCTVIGYYIIWSLNGAPVFLLYFAVFLIFVIFLIGGYFLTSLLILLSKR